jgi:outer membrane murein-binding lipoprotein Lpp
MVRLVVIISAVLLLSGCATIEKQDKMQEQLEAIETQLAELEEGTVKFAIDYGVFKQNQQQFNGLVYQFMKESAPHVHRHPEMDKEQPKE